MHEDPLWPADLDALLAAPRHHSLLMENEHVRVIDTHIPPGETTALHTHRWPASLYILSRSEFVRRDANGAVLADSRASSDSASQAVAWSPALPPHTLENVGTSTLHVISVELKHLG